MVKFMSVNGFFDKIIIIEKAEHNFLAFNSETIPNGEKQEPLIVRWRRSQCSN